MKFTVCGSHPYSSQILVCLHPLRLYPRQLQVALFPHHMTKALDNIKKLIFIYSTHSLDKFLLLFAFILSYGYSLKFLKNKEFQLFLH